MYEQAKLQWPVLSEYLGGLSDATSGVMRSRLGGVAVLLGED